MMGATPGAGGWLEWLAGAAALLPAALGYAEIHFRLPGIPSRLFHREPELLFDLPHRATHGRPVPLFLIAKDGDRYPATLHRAIVSVTGPDGSHRSTSVDLDGAVPGNRWFERVVPLGEDLFPEPGDYRVRAALDYEANGKARRLEQDNYRHLAKADFRIRIAAEDLPRLPGLHWGDLHIHSAYTDDAVEFGAPLAATARCATAVGLDFIAVTDHSFDLDNALDDLRRSDPALPRWTALLAEIDALGKTHPEMLILPGEEVSAGNVRGENVHCLVLGTRTFFPGSGDGGDGLFRNAPTLALTDLYHRVRESAPDAVIAAAHPLDLPPASHRRLLNRGRWHTEDLAHPGLDFWQVLNGRQDEAFHAGVERWRRALLAGRRVGILGGTDAHGNFNRFRQVRTPFWSMTNSLQQRLGEARTGVWCDGPLTEGALLSALREKRAAISTGPALGLELLRDGHRHLPGGTATGRTGWTVRVRVASTAEFGPLESVVLHVGDMARGRELETVLEHGLTDFRLDQSWTAELPAGGGYLRASVRTVRDGVTFHALTNPVWVE